jgi:hypothetical protein
MLMPDDEDWEGLDEVVTIIDWIDNANALSRLDPDEDDDESPGTCDPMLGYDLDDGGGDGEDGEE